MRNAEWEMQNGDGGSSTFLNIPNSALRIPHYSPFHIPHSEFRILHSSTICLCGADRRDTHRQELLPLFQQWLGARISRNAGLCKKLQPIQAFVCFLFHNSHFCDELSSGSSSTCSPVISADGSPRSEQLIPQYFPGLSAGQCIDKPDDIQGKLLRASLQL